MLSWKTKDTRIVLFITIRQQKHKIELDYYNWLMTTDYIKIQYERWFQQTR